MNIHVALVWARKENKAIRETGWPPGIAAYHGMDNILRLCGYDDKEMNGMPVTMSIALLLSNDWELSDLHPYQKPVAEPASPGTDGIGDGSQD